MKHHQPQLCERVSALHRSGHGIKKNLQVEFALASPTSHKPDRKIEQAEPCLGSLSDLLLALQDELGQMSLWVSFFKVLFFLFLHVLLTVFLWQWASGVGGSNRCNSISWREGGSAEGAGEAGRQDGRKGGADHEAPQTPADGTRWWNVTMTFGS